MKIRCLQAFRNGATPDDEAGEIVYAGDYLAGTMYDLDDAQAARLLRDAPESFESVSAEDEEKPKKRRR